MTTAVRVTEYVGTELNLVLDLESSSYEELREEFLAMTARAQQDSGLTKANIARLGAGEFSKSTVYHYAGDPKKYKGFPKPKLLTKYLEICGFAPEQVVFAVARCELIRILYPEGNKTPSMPGVPRIDPPPGPDTAAPSSTNSPTPTAPVPAAHGGWSTKIQGALAGMKSLLKGVTAYNLHGLEITPVAPTSAPAVYGPPAPNPPWPGRPAGVRVESPGQIAARVVGEMFATNAHTLARYAGLDMVREVYRRASAGMLELPGTYRELTQVTMPVASGLLMPGDIVVLVGLADAPTRTFGLYLGAGEVVWVGTGAQVNRRPLRYETVSAARRLVWPAEPIPERQAAPPAEPPPAKSIAEMYELEMRELTEKIEALCVGIEPGRVALGKIELSGFPFEGGQEAFVRRVFEMTDLPLPADLCFGLPMDMVQLADLPVRPGDIVLTEHGYLGILAENNRLIHLGKRGWPREIGLSERLFVAAWRASPTRRGWALESAVLPVEKSSAGRTKPVGGQQLRPTSHPPLAAVVAMVCETVEAVVRHGMWVPVDARAFYQAAQARGVEFEPRQKAWVPVRHPARAAPAVRVDEPADGNLHPAPTVTKHVVMAPPELDDLNVVGCVSHWYKAIGAEVSTGEPLVQITNPLVDLELEVRSPSTGTLTEIAVYLDDTVEAGQRLGVVTERPPSAARPARRPTGPSLFSYRKL